MGYMIIKGNDLELVKATPSTVLGSCRYKLPAFDKDALVYTKIIECFKKYNIGAFFYNLGGKKQ